MLLMFLATPRAVSPDRIVLAAGGGDRESGPATVCRLKLPFACGMDRNGTLFVAEMAGRVLAIDRGGDIRRIAGAEAEGDSGDGGPALDARVRSPHHLLVLPNGDLLVADTMNHRIRRIDARTGTIEPFAGTGDAGFSGDGGPAIRARFGSIYCLALDSARSALFVDDLDNRRIRRIDMKTGVVTTVAGNGARGVPTEGAEATAAPLQDPRAITWDPSGRLYILERDGNALRVVDERGKIHTVVGTGHPGPASDGDAAASTLRGPKHLAVEPNGNVLIADTDNHVIRRYIVGSRRVVTVAGTGTPGQGAAGEPALEAALNLPHGVYVDRGGTIYICDSGNGRVIRIEKGRAGRTSGKTGQ